MLVYEETANDLHRELSRIEKSRHFVYVRSLITHCARSLRVKFCADKMRNAKLRNHLKGKGENLNFKSLALVKVLGIIT